MDSKSSSNVSEAIFEGGDDIVSPDIRDDINGEFD